MKFELEIDLQPNQVQKLKRHLEDFCYNNFCGQPVLRQTDVSGALPLAQKLLNGIIAADPNVIDEPKIADRVIKSLYYDCRKLVQSLGGNDR